MEMIKYILWTCLVLQRLLVASLANGDFELDITPTQIDIGLSDSLNVNCTFSVIDNPDIVALISLILSRANTTDKTFTELATISDYTGHNVNVLTAEDVKAVGVFNSGRESFLNMRWEYPAEQQAGEYKCAAQGVGPLGHIMVLHDVIQVTANQPSTDGLKDKVKEMDIRMKYLEQIVTQNMLAMKENDSVLGNNLKSLEEKVMSLGQERLNNISVMFENNYLRYNNHKYYVSRDTFNRIEASYAICHVYGGWLVEIDDVEEYKAIQNFMKNISGIANLIISGTDEGHEGTWLLPSTNQPLPYIDWSPGNTDQGNQFNCLMLYSTDWRMWDYYCYEGSPSPSGRYMCEIPNI